MVPLRAVAWGLFWGLWDTDGDTRSGVPTEALAELRPLSRSREHSKRFDFPRGGLLV
jgi:hypothetical protein